MADPRRAARLNAIADLVEIADPGPADLRRTLGRLIVNSADPESMFAEAIERVTGQPVHGRHEAWAIFCSGVMGAPQHVLAVIGRASDAEEPGPTVAALAEQTGLSEGETRRLVCGLCEQGLASWDATGLHVAAPIRAGWGA